MEPFLLMVYLKKDQNLKEQVKREVESRTRCLEEVFLIPILGESFLEHAGKKSR
jgi:hypothetical protein